MVKQSLLGLLLCAVITSLLILGCTEDRNKNVKYLRDTLGPIVLAYKQKHGKLPDTFDVAHEESGVTLPNRGDAYGNNLIYVVTGPSSFYFLSYGPNGKDDQGTGDDLKVEYVNGTWYVR